MDTPNALQTTGSTLPTGLQNAIMLWADATTDATSRRRHDLLRDKTRAVASFFRRAGKPAQLVTALDVKEWQAQLEAADLAPATVYARISRLSSFYRWALEDEALGQAIGHNPVDLARPKAPKAYQTEATQALADEQVRELLSVVRDAARRSVVGKRDLAMLLMYLGTGWRRAEVARLRWRDVRINGVLYVRTIVKGGEYTEREIADRRVRDALLDYLKASGRLAGMQADDPLWTAHDRSGLHTGTALTSHAFVKNLKRYAQLAGIDAMHLHQTRHTYARIVAEETGSIVETQDALGHKNASTTRVYVNRIAVKKDKHSSDVLDRFGA